MRRHSLLLACILASACRSRERAQTDPTIHRDEVPSAPSSAPSTTELPHPHYDPSPRAAADALQVVITKTQLLVDLKEVAPVPAPADAARDGFGAALKPSALSLGPVAPLAKAAADYYARAGDAGGADEEALVLADPGTPYRLFVEVLFTLGQVHVVKFHLLVISNGKSPPKAPVPPIPAIPLHAGGTKPLSLALHLGPDGVAFETAAGAIGAGCIAGAAGVTVPRLAGALDLEGVRRCAQQLKATSMEDSDVKIGATAATPYEEVIAIMDAVRTDGHVDLFPSVVFLAPR